MFYIDKTKEMTIDYLQTIINIFITKYKPKLVRYKRYFDGKQDIIFKPQTDEKPSNIVVTNFTSLIVDNFQGYLTGLPITLKSKDDIEELQRVLKSNDYQTEDNKLLENALIYGISYELSYLDENSEVKFTIIDSENSFPIYSNTVDKELLYFVRLYSVDNIEYSSPQYIVELYSNGNIRRFKSDLNYTSLIEFENSSNVFGKVPVSIFNLNNENVSIFDKVMTLQDAYNTLQSGEIDDFQSFCDAYLVLTNLTADEEDIASMRKNRLLMLDDSGKADYLTKSINDTQIDNMLANIEKNIFLVSNCMNFADDKLMAQSGIAIKYKLIGMESKSSNIEKQMRKALNSRIKFIAEILNYKGYAINTDDIEIVFTRNIPVDALQIAQMTTLLRGLVSDKTLLSLLPFVADASIEQSEVSNQPKIETLVGGDLNPEQAQDSANKSMV